MSQLITQLIDIEILKPHEEILEEHFQELLEAVIKQKAFLNPIIVDKNSYVILDGHHRFSVAKKLKLAKIPALMVDYFDDAVISVFPRREDIPVNKQFVIEAGLSGKLFPNKTTRHVINIPYSSQSYSLESLKELLKGGEKNG